MDVEILSATCAPNLKTLSINCRSFYLPHEFSIVILTAVYIFPDPNIATAQRDLHQVITEYENSNPNCPTLGQVRSGMGAYAGAARRRMPPAMSTLRQYSFTLRLAIAQADARPAMLASFR